jgi:hypothetical protein
MFLSGKIGMQDFLEFRSEVKLTRLCWWSIFLFDFLPGTMKMVIQARARGEDTWAFWLDVEIWMLVGPKIGGTSKPGAYAWTTSSHCYQSYPL